MPDQFRDSQDYLFKILEMMDLEHQDIKKKKYEIEQQIQGKNYI